MIAYVVSFSLIHYLSPPSPTLLTGSSSVTCSGRSRSLCFASHFFDDVSYTPLLSCPLFNAVCSFESRKVDCLSCTWVVPKLPDDLSGLRSTHNDLYAGIPPLTSPRAQPHQGNGGPGSIFCPYRSRRWWNFYCLQRNYAEPRSGLSWYRPAYLISEPAQFS